MSGLRLKAFPVRDLARFAAGAVAPGLAPLPSRRAAALARNPYAAASDPAVLAVLDGEVCVAYTTLMPGLRRVGGRLRKILWGSALYIAPAYRGTDAGLRLRDACRSQKRLMFCTGATDALAYMLSATETELPATVYYELSRPARGWGRPAAPPHRWVESLSAADLSGRYPPGADVFYRGPEAVNWMLRWPWVGEGRSPGSHQFSETRPLFRYRAARFFSAKGGRLLGAAVFLATTRLNGVVLKILDFHCGREERGAVLDLALAAAADCGADAVELPDTLHAFAAAKNPARRARRNFLMRTEAPAEGLESLEPDYCDGDTAFT